MKFKSYRVIQPTIAMFEEEGRHVVHDVPAGSIILVDGALDGDKLMNVLWDERLVMMFTKDLRNRAEPVED